ncbi:MAG: hypothetical protein JNL01_01870 [Bdellovibrionales bacterium]|nr:hypothetical protein [Bdellovibrionales bacterium]
MKILTTFFALLVSTSAFAAQTKNPVLEYTRTQGSVSPKYRVSTQCTIQNGEVKKSERGGVVGATDVTRRVYWTKQVNSQADLLDLIDAASSGQIVQARCMPAPGSPVENFDAVYQKKKGKRFSTKTVLLRRGSCGKHNTSSEAQTLIEFIEFNCIQQ